MAWHHGDSFDYYTTAYLARKWDDVHNTVAIGAVGRSSTNGLQTTSSGGTNGWVTKNLTSNVVTIVAGGAFSFSASTSWQGFLWFYDAGTHQVMLIRKADGAIEVRVGGSAGTIIGTSAAGVLAAANTFYYVEVKVLFHNSAGTVTIRVNGSTTAVLALTGVDTTNTANAYCTQVSFGNVETTGISVNVDDVYILDTTGGSFTDFLGDIHYETPLPDGAGTTTNWTPSAGSNYQNVDDSTAPNDDTDYNSSTTVGHIDQYAFAAMVATTGSILGVVVNAMDRKDDSGARTHGLVSYLSGTTDVGTAYSPGTSYTNHQAAFATKPGGGSWTISDVNAAEFGIKVVS